MSAEMPELPPQTCLARDTYTGEMAFGYEANDVHAYARAYADAQVAELVQGLAVLERWIRDAAEEDGHNFNWHAINAHEGADARALLAKHQKDKT